MFQCIWSTLLFFNPFPNKPWFLRICSTGLWKTLWEKEKLLVTSNFSFSHSVLYLLGVLTAISQNVKLSSANSLSLEESKTCCLGKDKTLLQTTNSGPFQTERVHRRQFLYSGKWWEVLQKGKRTM